MGLARPRRAILRRAHAKHQPRLFLAVVGSAFIIAACGSTSKATTTAGSSTIAVLDRYAVCVRDHGVSGFPDPSTTETPNGFGIDGYNFDVPSTTNTQSPAYESADETCQSDLGSGRSSGGLNAAFVAKARTHALAHAVCMREHGVPNFPDPVITVNGRGISQASGGAGIDSRAPAFQQAQKICGGG